MNSPFIQNMDGFTFREEVKKRPIALIPIGAIEMHGAHLPLGTDSILAERICVKIAEKVPSIIMPTLHYTQVWSLSEFSGSFTLSPELFTKMLVEIFLELDRNGFKTATVINTHLGNNNCIKDAARKYIELKGQNKDRLKILYLTYPGAQGVIDKVMNKSNFHGNFFHADEIETSYMLYLAPEFVDMDKAVNEQPQIPEMLDVTPIKWSSFTKTGVMGNAKAATVEKGETVINVVVEKIINYINRSGL